MVSELRCASANASVLLLPDGEREVGGQDVADSLGDDFAGARSAEDASYIACSQREMSLLWHRRHSASTPGVRKDGRDGLGGDLCKLSCVSTGGGTHVLVGDAVLAGGTAGFAGRS